MKNEELLWKCLEMLLVQSTKIAANLNIKIDYLDFYELNEILEKIQIIQKIYKQNNEEERSINFSNLLNRLSK